MTVGLQMELSPEENGKFAAKTSPDVAGFSGSTVARLPFIRGHSQLNPSVASSMHMGYKKVKFMCSSLGKILPRPLDMKLRYVGGETRMVALPRHITYEAFSRKMVELYGPDIILKYQLPEEDLDALVSVSCDEDLENMMEECDRLSAGEGLSRLRAFIFLASELDVQVLDEIANFKSSEQKFVDAINAIPGDILPPVHSTGKLYPTSDSFNEAYKAWNGIHSQDRDSFFSKNPYSEVFSMEEYKPSGDLHMCESFVPGNLQSSSSPFSHSAFMGQPGLSRVLEVPDIFKDDLASVAWRDSPSFLGQGVGHSYGESHWVTSSEMVVPAQFTNDDSREDEMYEVGHPFEKSSRKDDGNVQIAQGHSKYDRKPDKISRIDEASAPDPALASASGGSLIKKLESGETSKHLVGQSQSDSSVLSPGALLQRQLMSLSPIVDPSSKNFNADRTLSEVPIFFNRQPHSTMSGLDNQADAYNKHVLQQQWESLSIDQSSFGLDRQNRMYGNIDDQSLISVQLSTPAEISPISTVSSAAIFPVNTAPLSALGWKLQSEKNHQNMLPGYGSCITSMASISPQDNTALMVSSGQVSANVASSAKPAGEIAKIDLTSVPVHSMRQETGDSNRILLTEEPYTVLSSQMTDKEDLVTDVDELKKSLSHVKGSVPSLITSDDRMVESKAIQGDNHTNYFPLSVKDQQVLGSALPMEALLPTQLIAADVHQYKINQADNVSKEEISPPAMIGGSHKSDMLSELLGSARLTECSGETSSAAENLRLMSESLPDEELHHKEGEKSSAVEKQESLPIANESLDFSIPTQDNFPSFQTTQNSLTSNDNCDKVVALAFATTLNDGNSNFANTNSLRNTATISNPHCSQFPVFTSLIQSWEASLLQDEDEHQKMEHVMPEHIQNQIDATPTFDKEIELEDSAVEFEEVQEFQVFNYEPLNAASIAEQEAIARGLQIIRNSDLEELHELGSGTFGTVYHGKWRGTDVAIKRIKASCFSGRQAERDRLVADFWREAFMLGQLHHPNVVAFYGVVPDGPGATLATVTEYMVNGSLKQVLQNKDRTLDRRKRLLIAMDAAFGMEYLHGKNVVHFDIKCENLLVNLRDTQRPICKVSARANFHCPCCYDCFAPKGM